MVTLVAVGPTVALKHLTPEAPEAKLREITVPVAPTAQVIVGPPTTVAGEVPTPPVKMNAPHSFATPIASPTAEAAAAAFRACRKLGRATAERMPTIATTLINSIKVKPFWIGLLLSCRLRIRASFVFGEIPIAVSYENMKG